jgi:uncharacterized repeat protein (TIGR02543 family)
MRTETRHKGKKLLCLLLVFCITFSIVPMNILAESTESEQIVTEETSTSQTESPELGYTAESVSELESTVELSSELESIIEPASEPEIMEELETKARNENVELNQFEEEISKLNALQSGNPINAALYDDSNAWVNFDGAVDSAAIGYSSNVEKDYNMRAVLTFPSSAANKNVTITLAEGVKFQADGSEDATVASLLDGAVVNSTNAAPYGLSSNMTNTGSKTYHFGDGVMVATLSLTVRADSRYWFDNSINDAITISMNYDGLQQYEVKLEELTVDSSNKASYSGSGNYTGYAPTDTDISIVNTYRNQGISFIASPNTTVSHFYENFKSIIQVSDPNCVVINTDPENWTLDDTYSASGTYTFTYRGGSAVLASNFYIPVQFNFPSSGFSGGDEIIVTRNANAKLYGGKEIVWASRTMKFTIANSDSEVFVNYNTLTGANNASVLNGDTTAWTGTTSPVLSGSIGWYSIGNKGGTASAEQIIELHFDQDKLGVLGLYLAIPYGQTVNQVEYQTVNSGSWITNSGLSLTAISDQNQTRYTSWADLGIATDPTITGDYITAIRYTLDSIPSSTVLGYTTAADYRNGIYGVTLNNGVDTTAISTVSAYTPDANESEWITGKIYSDHTKSYGGISFASVSSTSVSKSAGETFTFSQQIYAANSNGQGNMYRNSAVEHPIIYLRSESGNPITNIKIVNSRQMNITSSCTITSIFDGSVWTYKIDTASVPGDGAAVAFHSIKSNGMLDKKYITLFYDIATKSTDSSTYNYVDMIFVETPLTDDQLIYGANAQTTVGTHLTHANIGTGAGRVWYLPAGNAGSYTIVPRTDIAVSLSAKHYRASDSTYATWTEGSEPIAIGVGTHSAMEIKLDVTNLSGMAVDNETIIYLPIPKDGEDWGKLMYNNKDFEFSMNIKNQIAMPSGITGTIEYGTVTPTDDSSTLNSYTFGTWNESSADNYNCIKIVLTNLPNSSNPISFIMQVEADKTNGSLDDGLVDIWSSYYYEDLTNSEGKQFTLWVQGSYLATQTALGEIQGYIWQDDNMDGVKDPEENTLNIAAADGWTVDVYDAGMMGTGSPLMTVKIGEDDDGTMKPNYYNITDILSSSGNYDLVVNNPDNAQYIFTCAGTGITDNKAVGTSSDSHQTGVIEKPVAVVPTSGSLGAQEALYNIGVVHMSNPNINSCLSWQSQDSAKGTVTIINADLGSNTMSSGLPYETVKAVVSVTAATGYTFQGWALSATGAVDSSISKMGPYGVNGLYGYDDIDYYAVFTPNSYTINYVNHQGISYSPPALPGGETVLPTSYVYGLETIIGDAEPYDRTGYTFTGWYDAETDGNQVMNISDTTVGNVTLYARWSVNSYNIIYENLNGMTNSNPSTYTYGVGIASLEDPGIRTGYTFTGWYDAETDGNQVMNISDTEDGNVTLYARWSVNSYNIIYENLNGMTNSNPSTYTYGVGIAFLEDPGIRTGYTFTGWYDAETDGNQVMNISDTEDGNVTLYARWSVNSYTVTFDKGLNGTMVGSVMEAVNHGECVTGIPEIIADTGYVFIGWKSSEGSSIYDVSGIKDYIITRDVTFTAQYMDSEEATVIFDYNGGIMDGAVSGSVSGKPGTAYSVPVPIRTGYTLSGWAPKIPDETYGEAGSVTTYTAQWVADSYTVIYNANGGKGSRYVDNTTYGETYTVCELNITGIVCDGYIFKGWNTKADGSGTSYAADSSIKISGDVTLYAQWEKREFKDVFSNSTSLSTTAKSISISGTSGIPKTGDANNIWPWSALLAVSMTGTVYVLLFYRKKRNIKER